MNKVSVLPPTLWIKTDYFNEDTLRTEWSTKDFILYTSVFQKYIPPILGMITLR